MITKHSINLIFRWKPGRFFPCVLIVVICYDRGKNLIFYTCHIYKSINQGLGLDHPSPVLHITHSSPSSPLHSPLEHTPILTHIYS